MQWYQLHENTNAANAKDIDRPASALVAATRLILDLLRSERGDVTDADFCQFTSD